MLRSQAQGSEGSKFSPASSSRGLGCSGGVEPCLLASISLPDTFGQSHVTFLFQISLWSLIVSLKICLLGFFPSSVASIPNSSAPNPHPSPCLRGWLAYTVLPASVAGFKLGVHQAQTRRQRLSCMPNLYKHSNCLLAYT